MVPGRYTVRLTVDGRAYERAVEVRDDPRVKVTAAVRAEWTATLLRIADAHRRATELVGRQRTPQTEEVLSRLARLYGDVGSWTGPMTTDQRTQLEYLTRKLTELANGGR